MIGRRPALGALTAACLVALAGAPVMTLATDEQMGDDACGSGAMTLPEGDWALAWSDEFDGPPGSPPDPGTWGYDLGDGSTIGLTGWGNDERQWYTDEPANVALDGEGHLVITALESDGSVACYYGPCEYTSARLLTQDRFAFQHGFIETRMRVPAGFGLWPAFWLLGTNIDEVSWPASGEIDVMEYVGRRPNEVFGTLHGPGYSGSSGISGSVDLGEPVADAFHTMALEWAPGRMVWYLDGAPYHEVSREQVAPNDWAFEQPFFMLLNIAVGGNLGGPVFPDTEFPARMLVDYVRLYRMESE